jgi:transposase
LRELERALKGAQMRRIEAMEADVAELDKRLREKPIVAEIGTDTSAFVNAAHLASWSTMCPGIHESAGKSAAARSATPIWRTNTIA